MSACSTPIAAAAPLSGVVYSSYGDLSFSFAVSNEIFPLLGSSCHRKRSYGTAAFCLE